MEEIKTAARKNFSEQEIDDFIHMAKKITCKAVLTHVCEILKTVEHTDAPRLIARLEKLMPVAAGCIIVDLAQIEMKLNISLSICPRDYVASIPVPDDPGFKQDLYSQYDAVKKLAVQYWRQFSEDEADLVTQIAAACPNVNFDELVIGSGTANTTLYFDETCPKRCGIFPYYTDLSGRPFVKRGK